MYFSKTYTLSFAILILLCWACASRDNIKETYGTVQPYKVSKKLHVEEDALHFYVLGDWGRKGQFNQKELAYMMNETGYKMEPEFIISTGDNFYPNGVASIHDPQWKSSFEDIYDGYFLNCDWYVALGNHDYRGNADAEIEYSQISKRWNMPDRYFTIVKGDEDEPTVRLIFVDTNPFELEYHEETKYKDKVAAQDTVRQKIWMDSVMALNDADWKVVVGHHPMYTGGKRSDEINTVRNSLEPFLIKHNIPLYLAGHEHDLQHIKPSGPTHHFISGAGSEVRPTGKLPSTLFAESIQGFLAVSATKDKLILQAISFTGEVLYTTEILNSETAVVQ